LSPGEVSRHFDSLADIAWSRDNPDWIKLGILEVDEADGGYSIRGAGRTLADTLIGYLREK
jgi:hypothetical protein